jgi:hypothetical protein
MGDEIPYQALVAQMDSIKVPDGNNGRRIDRGQLLQTINYLHGAY